MASCACLRLRSLAVSEAKSGSNPPCRTEDPHELEREELEAMMLASSAMAASLVQEARDVASHVMSGEDALKDPNAELLQVGYAFCA